MRKHNFLGGGNCMALSQLRCSMTRESAEAPSWWAKDQIAPKKSPSHGGLSYRIWYLYIANGLSMRSVQSLTIIGDIFFCSLTTNMIEFNVARYSLQKKTRKTNWTSSISAVKTVTIPFCKHQRVITYNVTGKSRAAFAGGEGRRAPET